MSVVYSQSVLSPRAKNLIRDPKLLIDSGEALKLWANGSWLSTWATLSSQVLPRRRDFRLTKNLSNDCFAPVFVFPQNIGTLPPVRNEFQETYSSWSWRDDFRSKRPKVELHFIRTLLNDLSALLLLKWVTLHSVLVFSVWSLILICSTLLMKQ